jgi:hypothetical protein
LAWHENVWDELGLNPNVDKTFAFLMLPEFVEYVVSLSEEYRAQLNLITQFIIKEDQTIQFKTTREKEVSMLVQMQVPERGRRLFLRADRDKPDPE